MNINMIPDAMVISVDYGFYNHVGLLGEARPYAERSVVSASWQQGKVVEESVSQFADGRVVRIVGYPGALPPWLVLMRARAMLNTPYRLLAWNCDHLVHHAHGLSPNSPQIRQAVGAVAFGVVALAFLAHVARSR